MVLVLGQVLGMREMLRSVRLVLILILILDRVRMRMRMLWVSGSTGRDVSIHLPLSRRRPIPRMLLLRRHAMIEYRSP